MQNGRHGARNQRLRKRRVRICEVTKKIKIIDIEWPDNLARAKVFCLCAPSSFENRAVQRAAMAVESQAEDNSPTGSNYSRSKCGPVSIQPRLLKTVSGQVTAALLSTRPQ